VHVLSGGQYPLAKKVLAPGGTFLTLEPSPASLLRDVTSRLLPGPRHRTVLVKSRREDLAGLAGLIERGDLRPPVGQTLPLVRIREAHAQLQTGHTVGKLVLTVPDYQ
jgi:NADPH:quinone reductase-like Zn-dependent oxidoreductase